MLGGYSFNKERVRGYAVIMDGWMLQIICKTCRKRFWNGLDEH
jgi:hypothetical protein